eukprot:gene22001-biopygen7169
MHDVGSWLIGNIFERHLMAGYLARCICGLNACGPFAMCNVGCIRLPYDRCARCGTCCMLRAAMQTNACGPDVELRRCMHDGGSCLSG